MSEILNRAVTKGRGFPPGYNEHDPVYFRRKQKKNETKRTPRLFISPPTHCKYRPDNLKLDVGFFVNQTFTMAFNPSLSKDFQVWFLPLPFRISPSWWKLLQTIIMEMIGQYFWLTSQKTQNPTVGNVLSATVVRKH